MSLLLGIDIGTSSVKALLFDPNSAQTLAVAGQEYPIHQPAPDRAEQNPDDWWRATCDVAQRAVIQAGRTDVSGIGFSGQMHGTVLLGQDQKPIHPAIIWADQRSAEVCVQLIKRVAPERYSAIAGTLPAAGFMVSTLAWLAEHQPALLEQTAQVILPKDYVRLRMTGEVATEVSDGASSGIFDVSHKTWSDTLIREVGLPTRIFPPVLASSALAGHLTTKAAAELGLRPGIPVIAGCADQPAQAIANGLVAPGRASVTTGSGGQVFVPLPPDIHKGVPTDPRLHVFNHAAPDMWYVLGAILAAGLSLRWFRNLVGLESAADAYSMLSAEASRVPPGAEGLLFLPYLNGERTPHMDAAARGVFLGLSYHHGRGHLARAIMEGVSFALRQALEISLSLGGKAEAIIAAGGGAESDIWRQIQADILGLPLQRNLLAEQAAIGAALLAGVGTGTYHDLHEACRQVVRYGLVTEPNLERHAHYNELYEQFVALYPSLRDNMHRLAAFARKD